MIRIVSNATMVSASFISHAANVDRKTGDVVIHHGALLQTRVKAHASGRPGPRTITGDYRRSISRRSERTPIGATAWVGTNSPQGRRLEFGFTGVDSIGRYYDQPPYPHFGPALDEITPKFLEDLGRVAVGDD